MYEPYSGESKRRVGKGIFPKPFVFLLLAKAVIFHDFGPGLPQIVLPHPPLMS